MESENLGGVSGGNGGRREVEKKFTVVDIGSTDTWSFVAEDSGENEEKERRITKLSSREMESLDALCDTFLPSVDVPNDVFGVVGEPTLKFLKTSAAKAGTPYKVVELITQRMKYHVFLLRLSLLLLSTRIGTLILCGRASVSSDFPFFYKFADLSLDKRQKIALSWSTSWFRDLRLFFVGMKSFILLAFFTQGFPMPMACGCGPIMEIPMVAVKRIGFGRAFSAAPLVQESSMVFSRLSFLSVKRIGFGRTFSPAPLVQESSMVFFSIHVGVHSKH